MRPLFLTICMIVLTFINISAQNTPVPPPERAKEDGLVMIEKYLPKIMDSAMEGFFYHQRADVGQTGVTKEFRTKFKDKNGTRSISFLMDNVEISIEGHRGDDIIIKAEGYREPPARADGLMPLNSRGTDNSGIGLSIKEEEGTIKIVKATKNHLKYHIKIPQKTNVKFDYLSWTGSDALLIDNIEGELEVVSKNSDINLTNISGPIVANTISGNITISYANFSKDKPSSFSVVSGFVDITMPSNTKSNLRLSSIDGEVYSGLDIELQEQENPRNKGLHMLNINRVIEGKINGGGPDLNIKIVNGNVYLRKQK